MDSSRPEWPGFERRQFVRLRLAADYFVRLRLRFVARA
jgi:hypothetical protein